MKYEDFWLEHRLTGDDVVSALLACAICLGAGVMAATYFDLKSTVSEFERGVQPRHLSWGQIDRHNSVQTPSSVGLSKTLSKAEAGVVHFKSRRLTLLLGRDEKSD
jgi:hypothetical protein